MLFRSYYASTLSEFTYSDDADYWDNPHLEILQLDTTAAFEPRVPAGLIKARNLRALAINLKQGQLASAIELLPRLDKLSYLSAGYGDLGPADIEALQQALPDVFIGVETISGKSEYEFPISEELRKVEGLINGSKWREALDALGALRDPPRLRAPQYPGDIASRWVRLVAGGRLIAMSSETDPGRVRAYAGETLAWADGLLAH